MASKTRDNDCSSCSHQFRSETTSSGPEISAVQYSLALTPSTVGLSQYLDRFHPGSAVMELAAQRLVQQHHLPCLQGRPWCIIVKVPARVTGDHVILRRTGFVEATGFPINLAETRCQLNVNLHLRCSVSSRRRSLSILSSPHPPDPDSPTKPTGLKLENCNQVCLCVLFLFSPWFQVETLYSRDLIHGRIEFLAYGLFLWNLFIPESPRSCLV